MAKSFSAAIDQWARKVEGRTEAIFKTAVQRTAEDANRPKAQGGRMPVRFGFLRGSQVAEIGAMPSGPSDPNTDAVGNPEDINLVIGKAVLGDTIFVGWSAKYARAQEARNAFAEAAAQKWPRTVREVTAEAKRRIR